MHVIFRNQRMVVEMFAFLEDHQYCVVVSGRIIRNLFDGIQTSCHTVPCQS